MACGSCSRRKAVTGFGSTPPRERAVKIVETPKPVPHTLTLADGSTKEYGSALEAHTARITLGGGTVAPSA